VSRGIPIEVDEIEAMLGGASRFDAFVQKRPLSLDPPGAPRR